MSSRYFDPLIACLCSGLAWSGLSVWLLPLSLAFPLLLGRANTRREATIVTVAYFLGALYPCVPASRIFFGQDSYGGGLVLLACVLMFFGMLFRLSLDPILQTGLLLVHAVSPFGVASPLVAAGVVFPGLGFGGLALILVACWALAARQHHALCGLAVVSLLSHVFYQPAAPLSGWEGRQTAWGNTAQQSEGDWVRLASASSADHGKVILLPETTMTRWEPAVGDLWFAPQFEQWAKQGMTVAFGAIVPIPHSREYRNALVVRGADHVQYIQRFPVPLGMWGRQFPLQAMHSGVIQIHGKTVGVLLCYEQLLVWPVLQSAAEGAQALLAPSNLYWAKGTTIGATERIGTEAWGRLFQIPIVKADNQ